MLRVCCGGGTSDSVPTHGVHAECGGQRAPQSPAVDAVAPMDRPRSPGGGRSSSNRKRGGISSPMDWTSVRPDSMIGTSRELKVSLADINSRYDIFRV
ncbi:hypothetical protein TNIN_406481 [Trichonephila inaurata madagascariensis]|uniref:Uncharacterized protein n=1 Tax=Trichonephila inaurata madagascariensis TaxID=2747483 RepID=A0A8X6WUJ7_9ARAC|nr:hypothetical protein TNIN_406481 [Trichonephila inaurata madagascariensis]